MADEPQNQPGQEPDDDDDAPGGARETDDQQTSDGVDAEVRKRNAEARRLRLERNELRDRLKAIEDRDKSEQQKLTERAEAAERRAQQAEQHALRYEVAVELGISQHAARLHGDTREALVADAKAFAKTLGLDSSNGERPNFSSGVRRPVQRPKTMNDVIRQAAGR